MDRMNTLSVFNSTYPIMADLGNGWYLVKHPNGPAIAKPNHEPYLGHLASHPNDTADNFVPWTIRWEAVDKLMEWAVRQPGYKASVKEAITTT